MNSCYACLEILHKLRVYATVKSKKLRVYATVRDFDYQKWYKMYYSNVDKDLIKVKTIHFRRYKWQK